MNPKNLLAAAIIVSLPTIVSAKEAPVTVDNAAVKKATKAKDKKITDRHHPDYVRCRSEKVIGSLSKRRRVCMTNKQWADYASEGNDLAAQFLEQNRAGGVSGSN